MHPAKKLRPTADPFELFKKLLEGCYIKQRSSHNKMFDFCLYEGKSSPIGFVNKKAYLKIKDLLRKGKKSELLLDKRGVIQLHGNNRFKKYYKQYLQSKNLKDGTRVNQADKGVQVQQIGHHSNAAGPQLGLFS